MLLRRLPVLLLLFVAVTLAQESAPSSDTPAPHKTAAPKSPMQIMVDEQFGPGFKLDPKFEPQKGDFDGDGEEDIALVATGGKPLGGESGYDYKVEDPYNGYFGWGNPKVTSQFGSADGGPARRVLIIHSWQKPTPKAKFVLINLPLESWQITKQVYKKKKVTILEVEERNGMGAMILFDGKKHHWAPGDTN